MPQLTLALQRRKDAVRLLRRHGMVVAMVSVCMRVGVCASSVRMRRLRLGALAQLCLGSRAAVDDLLAHLRRLLLRFAL
jgi:hypothetical protein